MAWSLRPVVRILFLATLIEVIGFGMVLPTEVLIQLIVGQYLIKLGIAIAETPVVYAIVGAVESTAEPEPTATQADPS